MARFLRDLDLVSFHPEVSVQLHPVQRMAFFSSSGSDGDARVQ